MTDERYMKRALDFARKGAGHTSPNPLVGAVVVKGGRIIGEGYHRTFGGKHAEVEAIEAAIEPVAGATLYCNLEPCCYTHPEKHQPPCTERIIRERIDRVVVANLDPNPKIDGEGLSMLVKKGVAVTKGVLAEEGATLNETFFKFIRTHTPFVTLKIAQSLDGRIATGTGHSKWITDGKARLRVHRIRAAYDAVLVGAGTVRQDNPALTVRHASGRDPVRVILSSQLSLPLGAQALSPEVAAGTIIVTTSAACSERVRLLKGRGAEVLTVKPDVSGRPDLREALNLLGARKILSLLVEGGAEVFTSFIRERLFDKIAVFISPIIIGSGTEAVADLRTEKIDEALRLVRIRIERIGDQVLVEGYRERLPPYAGT